MDINSIRNVFPKDNAEWLNWISQGKHLYLDKQKIQELIDQQRTNLADVEYLNLDLVTKIINEFENPTIPEEKDVENSVKAQYSLQGNSLTAEEQRIVDEAKANGTYLKAPNGKASNLNERQWIQVRTKAFKDWFGDWELAAKVVKIISANMDHGFKNFAEARKWAKEKILGTYINPEIGEIVVSGKAIDKYLSGKAVGQSHSLDAHLSALQVLPQLIENSIVGEVHEDRSHNENLKDIVRLFGAINIGNETSRVKITVKRYSDKNAPNKAYSYEVTEIEPLEGTLETTHTQNADFVSSTSNNSITGAKLLKGIENSKGLPILNSSKVVDENGEPMVVYHGSYWNPLEEAEGKAVFDDSFRGTSSGDNGWFGRGHYFAFGNGKLSKAEARYYGPNVFDAFLNIRNPFMYAETIYKDYNPTNGKSEHNASLVAINTAKAFPNLVEDFQVEQFDGNGDKVDSISIKDYADIFDKIYKEKEFIVEESDEYPNVIIVKADPIEHTDEDLNISWDEYGWDMRMIAPAEREDKQFTFAHHYLTQEVYGREGHSFYILPDRDLKAFSESEEFTSILKERGYDGVLQSAIGDEAVAFEPTQIKRATDNVGTFDASNPDIRYSLASDMARDAAMTALEGAGIDVEMATPEMVEDVLRARDAEFHIAYHGSGAKFDEFDHSHMGEGEGAQDFTQ